MRPKHHAAKPQQKRFASATASRRSDIVHHHFDFDRGQHQKTRGGASVGKAIALIDAIAKSKGTGAAKLWDIWKSYKDVAHLITATVLISGEATARHRKAPYQAKLHQFQPYRMAMLLPDLVISVAMSIESYGLPPCGTYRAPGRFETKFVRERLMDAIAARLSLDRIDVRRRNLVAKEEMPYGRPLATLSTEVVLDSG